MTSSITPFLWFDTQAEAAMTFYTSIFERSRIISIKRYPDVVPAGPMKGNEGRVLNGAFELAGQRFQALDGGPHFRFTPAISLFVNCATEAECATLWERLGVNGTVLMPLQAYPFSPQFGWLQDQFGLSWQVSVSPVAQKITPCLMFVGAQHGQAEAALRFYQTLFPASATLSIDHYGANDTGTPGTVKHALFQLAGSTFMAMDSNFDHAFAFNESISFYVECASQAEVDQYWAALSAVPEAEQCGWLKDKFGISWQIIPAALDEWMSNPDPATNERLMNAILSMKKLDMAALQRAYAGVTA